MIFKIKNKINSIIGMTVLETLVSVFILAMVMSVVAVGIPTAANAYNKVLDSANAHLLLSTGMTKLRDELEAADMTQLRDNMKEDDVINYDGITIDYTNNNGESQIFLNEEKAISEKKKNRLLVSQKASNDNLYLTYTSIKYTGDSGYVTFEGLAVKKKDNDKNFDNDQVLAGPLDYSVKLLREY